MNRKTLKNQTSQVSLPAAGPSPADFPLGSPESRAAARARVVLAKNPRKLSQIEQDALTLYGNLWSGNREILETSTIYQRGEKLHDLLYGPPIPAHLDEHLKRSTSASNLFELVHCKEPQEGDILAYPELAAALTPDVWEKQYRSFVAAWERQLPGIPHKSKFENGRFFILVRGGQEEKWHECQHIQPQWFWYQIERELLFPQPWPPSSSAEGLAHWEVFRRFEAEIRPECMPSIPAVRFLGIVRGRLSIPPALFGSCGSLGIVDINFFDEFLVKLLPALAAQGVSPGTFPIFLLHNVVTSFGTSPRDLNACCFLGYHGTNSPPNSPVQTYSPSDFDTTGLFSGVSDTSVLAHEIGEWANDPFGNNPTPLWGHTGQVPIAKAILKWAIL